MKIALVVSLLGSLLLAAGCEQPITMPNSTAVQIPASAALGRPHNLSSESHMGYWLYEDEDSVWHLRTATQRVEHRFEGSIHPFPGTVITDLKPVASKRNDELRMDNGDIWFHFHPHENVDGIDFRLVGPPALEFAIKIDGDYDPTHIYIGRGRVVPEEAHFILTP